MSNPWYAFYPGDYGRDTAHLSLAEDGAYRRLLDYLYSTGRPIPAGGEQAFRICRAFYPPEQAAVTSVLSQFFFEEPDGLHNKRADVELAKSKQITADRVRAGQASALKRELAAKKAEVKREAKKGHLGKPTRVGSNVGSSVPTSVQHLSPQPQPQPQATANINATKRGGSFKSVLNLSAARSAKAMVMPEADRSERLKLLKDQEQTLQRREKSNCGEAKPAPIPGASS
jgi:uncharacterized protein YdaU (DUF1376 family)